MLQNKLNRQYRALKEARPGERFTNFYHRMEVQRRSHRLKRVLTIILGILLTVSGFLLGFVPLSPGIIPGLLGLALIASQFKTVAVFLDRSEVALRRWYSHFKSRGGPM